MAQSKTQHRKPPPSPRRRAPLRRAALLAGGGQNGRGKGRARGAHRLQGEPKGARDKHG